MDIGAASASKHRWTFKREGGIFQAQVGSVADLENLFSLDPKLWTALSCPVHGLEIDPKTLALIDVDADGRVRMEELLNALHWTLARLDPAESLFAGGDLPLDAIRHSDEEGKALYESACQILANTGAQNPGFISVTEAANTDTIFGKSKLNGDGIIACDASEDPRIQQAIRDIVQCLGPAIDRSGDDGIDGKRLTTFYAELKAIDAWWRQGEEESTRESDVFPLGTQTPDAFNALTQVEAKIDDFFGRCRLSGYDSRATEALNREGALYKQIAGEDFSRARPEVEALPLAKIAENAGIPLDGAINPEWRPRFETFTQKVIHPLFQNQLKQLDEEHWQKIRQTFASYRRRRAAKPATAIEPLGIARVRELLEGDFQDTLQKLIAEDLSIAPRVRAIDSVEKLARLHRDLIQIIQNFVNFSDFYHPERNAIFQAGTLFLDGRECKLCLRVADPAKHATLAGLSRAFIVYCECRRQEIPDRFHIAAVLTNGDSTNLIVGRNGVFRDNRGDLWDSTVVRIIENPIGIREAFLMPYVRLGRFIGDQVEKWASNRDQKIQNQLQTGVETVGNEPTPKNQRKSAIPLPNGLGGAAGMLAAGGIALGAFGAGLSSLVRTVQSLAWWEVPLVIGAVILTISLPSMTIAWLKIRQRTLAPLLDASGWAVNGRTLITPQHGHKLTLKASLPLDAISLVPPKAPTIRSGIRIALYCTLGLVIASLALWLWS